jgi:hypothetical protein
MGKSADLFLSSFISGGDFSLSLSVSHSLILISSCGKVKSWQELKGPMEVKGKERVGGEEEINSMMRTLSLDATSWSRIYYGRSNRDTSSS